MVHSTQSLLQARIICHQLTQPVSAAGMMLTHCATVSDTHLCFLKEFMLQQLGGCWPEKAESQSSVNLTSAAFILPGELNTSFTEPIKYGGTTLWWFDQQSLNTGLHNMCCLL